MYRLATLAAAVSIALAGVTATIQPAEAHHVKACVWKHHKRFCNWKLHRHVVCKWKHHRKYCRPVWHR